MKEREELVRSEYDKILTSKLAGMFTIWDGYTKKGKKSLILPCIISTEQYDTFVKFSHDQIERRLAESAFSCKLKMVTGGGW